MVATQLSLYNGALRILGERKLSSLTENCQSRRLLDDAWDDGAVNYCLSQGEWDFATRTQQLDASTSIEPDFGYQYAFELPDDWLRAVAVCTDEYYRNPLLDYDPEARIIYCDWNEIYVKFVSNDITFGGDYSLWSESFVDYAENYLASQISMALKQKEFDPKKLKEALFTAKKNTRNEKPTKYPPFGSFVTSRVRSGSGPYYSLNYGSRV